MEVIAVSSNVFCGGDSFAKALADRLGYRLIDADAVIERAAACGPSHEELNEAPWRAPRVWDRFLRKRQRNLIVLQAALAEELGRAGLSVTATWVTSCSGSMVACGFGSRRRLKSASRRSAPV